MLSSEGWLKGRDVKEDTACITLVRALRDGSAHRAFRPQWRLRGSSVQVYSIMKSKLLKAVSPEYSLEGLMLKLKLQYSGHLMQRAESFEKTLMLGKIEGRRRRG